MPSEETLAAILRESRLADDKTQEDVGLVIKANPILVSRWERGVCQPARKYRRALVKLFPRLRRFFPQLKRAA